jgi:hypothetical protein
VNRMLYPYLPLLSGLQYEGSIAFTRPCYFMPCHAMRHIPYVHAMPSVSLLLPLERILLDTTIASSRVREAWRIWILSARYVQGVSVTSVSSKIRRPARWVGTHSDRAVNTGCGLRCSKPGYSVLQWLCSCRLKRTQQIIAMLTSGVGFH